MTFDIVCLALGLFFAVAGLFRGLVRQFFGIAGLLGGFVLARLFAAPLAEQFHADLGLSVAVAAAVMGFAIFFLTGLAASIAGRLLTGALGTITGALNRVGGFAVGLLKGGVVVWVVASLAALAQPYLKSLEKNSPGLRKLDLDHSRAIAAARDTSVFGDKARELRARAEKEMQGAGKQLRSRAVKELEGAAKK